MINLVFSIMEEEVDWEVENVIVFGFYIFIFKLEL